MIIMQDGVETIIKATVTYVSIRRWTESIVQNLDSTGKDMAGKKQLNKQNN
jgi:hypothetical protein